MENSNIIYMAQLFQNDLKHIKAHAVGDRYDTIISLCDGMIKELDTEIEDLTAWLFEQGVPVDNLSNIRSYIDAEPLSQEAFDWNSFTSYLKESLVDYINELESLDQSWLSNYAHYWHIAQRDNEMRNFVPASSVMTPEETTEMASCLAPYFIDVPENDDSIDSTGALPEVDWSDMANTANFNSDPGFFVKDFDAPSEEDDENENESEDDEDEEKLDESLMWEDTVRTIKSHVKDTDDNPEETGPESESVDKEIERSEDSSEELPKAKVSSDEKKNITKSQNMNGWTTDDDD